ncbi:MAG: ABC transporter substrate-binding protein [Lachnospiraceae bacterium]|nr:ABC transporter substrate-binding protein [Lachnospiraceae bacterium]
MRRTLKKVIATTVIAAMTFSLTACGGSDKGSKDSKEKVYNIGICQLVEHEALDAATKGFKEALIEKLGEDKVKFDEQNAQGESATCATIVNSFVSSNVDLILANATAPLQSAANATVDIPILGTSVTDYATALAIDDFTGVVGNNVSGTSDLAPIEEQANMILELFPKAETVGLLYCSAEPNSKFQVDLIKKNLKKEGIKCKEYSFVDSNDIASVVQGAVKKSDVIYIPTDNTAASNTEVIDNIARPEGVPIVAGEAGICKGCGIATLSIDYYELGYETGLMAYDILVNGKDITKMEIKYAPKVTKQYNKKIADELKIKIPDGYDEIGE